MKISSGLFEAFLKCPTKCWLQATGESGSGNDFAQWVKRQRESYRTIEAERLLLEIPRDESAVAPVPANLKTGKWRLALDVLVQTPGTKRRATQGGEPQASIAKINQSLLRPPPPNKKVLPDWIAESRLHVVERVPPEGRGSATQFVPIRFFFANRLCKGDKLLLGFDAVALSGMLGSEIRFGKIIHGDGRATLKVRVAILVDQVRALIEKVAALLANPGPPDLVLNRHCAECEFRDRCRQKAIETDDLSLLAGMGAKDRQKFRGKGIFTVTQLSYTFRPRRQARRQWEKRETYHHALKALAIREKKVHVIGTPELRIEGTPVYLDVEGLPDRNSYYLIGLRFGNGDAVVQRSLWADAAADEGKIWREFLAILETIEKPVLIHYGSYETEFLRTMCVRYGSLMEGSFATGKAVMTSVNALSFVFGKIYFPTFSNGLKDVARFVGFEWSDPNATGTKAISLRHEWEKTNDPCAKSAVVACNREDCLALQRVVEFVLRLAPSGAMKAGNNGSKNIVYTDNLPRKRTGCFGPNHFQFPELEEINKAAYWDYQREKVLLKTRKQRPRLQQQRSRRNALRINKVISWPAPLACPKCGEKKLYKHSANNKIVLDLHFSKSGIKRWVTRFDFYRYRCTCCKAVLHNPERAWSREKFGRNLRAFVAYQVVELRLPQETVTSLLNRVFGFNFCRGTTNKLKAAAAEFYQVTYENLLKRVAGGRLIHADETAVDFKGRRGYIWAFTNLDEVAFVFAESREGETVKSVLEDFKGILVSDFYAVYDGIDCPRQKCLIHLIRDLNDDLMAEPFNDELKKLIADFTQLVRPMIATVDRYGLKARFLRKHKPEANRYFEKLRKLEIQSERARKCKTRLEKNQNTLFTFLDYDDVSWNNNNAEHAIKSFALLRRVITGVTTEKGIREYLILLSVCQTCKYMGVDFLNFLRSGETDIHAFADLGEDYSMIGTRGRQVCRFGRKR